MDNYVNLKWETLPHLPIYKYKETDSTNTRARELIYNENLRTGLFWADTQTCGRGRAGHSFYSPKDTGVYFSYVFTPDVSLDPGLITTAASVSVLRVLNRLAPSDYRVKWVNDIYLNERKIAGILTEGMVAGDKTFSVIVGIGINLDTKDFPKEIQNIAGSIGILLSKETLIEQIVIELVDIISKFPDTSFLDEYREKSMLTGCDISYVEGNITKFGHVIGIDDDGGLKIKTPDEEFITLRHGEVFTIRKQTT